MNAIKIMLTTVSISLLSYLNAADGFSGKIYYKWFYPPPSETSRFNEFSFDRVYLTYEKTLSPKVNIILTTDAAAPKQGAGWQVFQKQAYLQLATGVGNIRIGLQGLNMFNVSEKTWGYRFLAKTTMDAHGFASSTDMGLGFIRTFSENIHLHLTLTNGQGYKNAENDQYKKLVVQVVKGATDLSKNDGFNMGVAGSFEPYAYPGIEITTKSKSVVSVFGGLASPVGRIGGEFDFRTDSGRENTDRILAIYANYKARTFDQLKLNIFGRIENYDPDLDGSGDSDTAIIFGINSSPAAALNIAPNIRYNIPATGESGVTAFQLNFEFKY